MNDRLETIAWEGRAWVPKNEWQTLLNELAAIPCQSKGLEDMEAGCCAPCRARAERNKHSE